MSTLTRKGGMKPIVVTPNMEVLIATKDKMESFHEEKVRGMIVRARARWHEQVEESSKYYLNVEKETTLKNIREN